MYSAWDTPGTPYGMGYTMGWALAIPWTLGGYTPVHYPGTPLPVHPCTAPAGYTLQRPAQRLAYSIKTVISGSPIYHDLIDPDLIDPDLIDPDLINLENVPTFLIDSEMMRFPKASATASRTHPTSDGKSVVH